MNFKIVPGRVSHFVGYHDLYCSILREGGFFVASEQELPSIEAVMSFLSDVRQRGIYIIAISGHDLVGALTIQREHVAALRHVGRLQMMVHKEYRKKGIGSALLDAGIKEAESTFIKLSLAVFATNTPALDLYKSRGFIEEGYRKAEYIQPDGSFRDDLLLARFFN